MSNGTRRKQVPQNGAAIREIRRREGLTISELAQAIDVSDSHIRNIETNNKPARPEHLARIALRLHCDLEAIRNPVVDEPTEARRTTPAKSTPPFQPSGSPLPPSSPGAVNAVAVPESGDKRATGNQPVPTATETTNRRSA